MKIQNMKKKLLGAAALSVVALSVTACSNGSNDKKAESTNISKFPVATTNKEKAKKDGVMNVAVVADTQFKGIFSNEFYTDNYDATFMDPAAEGLFFTDGDFKIVDGGAANLKFDKKAKTATITLRDNLKWSDGQPVTADDVIFPYEVIGNKDYTGVRYDDNFTNIVGMEDYHKGTADTISGIKKVDDKTVVITYKEMHPGMLQSGGGVWGSAMPKHVFKGIAVKDMQSSDRVRKNPIFFGPYKMTKIVTGESVTFEPNEYYYGEKPKLSKLTLKTVPSASIVKALEAKQYDMALGMPTDIYPTYKSLKGYEILGRTQQAYTYLGFKMGKWNEEKNEVEYNPNAKMADKALRQAMGYAMDNNAVAQKFYNGIRSQATTLIPPVYKSLHDSDLKGYSYDIEKAKKILDKAGYKDVDGDGLREDKNGKKLTINFASMSGGEVAQPLGDYYLQEWKKIGLDVKYTTGRLLDFQAFYDKVEHDDPEIDVYQGAWSVSGDPSPSSLYGKNAQFNYTRFASPENTKLLKAIDSEASFDDKVRKENFDKWQKYALDQAFVIPTLYRNELLPVSKDVTGWDWAYDSKENSWATVGLTK